MEYQMKMHDDTRAVYAVLLLAIALNLALLAGGTWVVVWVLRATGVIS